ncbi:DUF899 domain-containing protein [Streptomyces turgidiscabies]|uniref:DUF899 domain-containing protein n=1 Tax=Streptomyces turgidiscabies (strain Car8) TaxID=698760 RepID=L7ESB4_STRT8|nr:MULTISPECIES: DUF899 domain-containing protein [Streptomyces]ELP61907.1 hypothetical protein STRTUCAR8_02846 [Streptomyces turgidiscabies Car8]MDX3497355.1 DUF899 domain-containing protein [Streptomyces turgidiscabies]GAQ72354.1 hypothetical protein T45_04102 [Streptomyces turgidiscabies]
MTFPRIVSRDEWRAAREALLVKEEVVTRARDALNAERRELPVVAVDEEYVFEGGDGKATLLDLFEGRRLLVVHHFMFAPEWDEGCPGCSEFLDHVGHLAHLWARDASFAVVSRAPYTRILPFKARMGWTVPWFSSYGNDFNRDFLVTSESAGEVVERSGVSCFLRDRDRVFHTYSAYGRGLEGLGSAAGFLDLMPLGPDADGESVRHHDAYDD